MLASGEEQDLSEQEEWEEEEEEASCPTTSICLRQANSNHSNPAQARQACLIFSFELQNPHLAEPWFPEQDIMTVHLFFF